MGVNKFNHEGYHDPTSHEALTNIMRKEKAEKKSAFKPLVYICSPYSGEETYFANTLFHPYIKKEKTKFDYDSKLFYFLTSLSWRSLYLDLIDFVENHVVGIDALVHLISCEKIMKDYLLNSRNDIEAIEHHIFFFDEIREITGNTEMDDLRPHVTFHRGIISYTFCFEDNGTYGTISNMMGIVLITLYKKGSREKWERTQILNGIGSIEAKDQLITSVVGNEFMNILKTTQSASNSISEKQMGKIVENLKIRQTKSETIRYSKIG